MKINSVQILLDKKVFYSSQSIQNSVLTGRVVVRTPTTNWEETGIVFVKLIDELDIEWTEDAYTSDGVTKQIYLNCQQPFHFNYSFVLNKDNVVRVEEDTRKDSIYMYPFEFRIPPRIQSSITIKHGKCQYFIKAYLTNDPNVARYYVNDANVYDEFFKNLNHTFAKQEVYIKNETHIPVLLNTEQHIFDAKTNHFRVVVTLPKVIYAKGDLVPIHVLIQHANEESNEHKHHLDLHKICFKLVELAKLTAIFPEPRVRITEHTIAHTNRRSLHENKSHVIVLEEYFPLPHDIHSSSRKTVDLQNHFHHLHHEEHHKHQYTSVDIDKLNPIKIEYKLCLEFWKSLFKDELNINIPIAISPEV